VDLDIGHRPSDWPAAFVSDFLERAMRGLRTREKIVGAIRLEGADTGRVFVVGEIASASPVVAGPEYALAAWLLGRSDGSDLSCEGAAGLPVVPAFYPV
jgi:maleylpyruvate isomerase